MKLILIGKSKVKPFQFCTRSMLCNNKGIALVMVMILSFISLAIMSGLIYMVTSGTQVSGLQKRYSTALQAGESGIDIAYQIFSKRGNPYTSAEAALIGFNFTSAGSACLINKLNNATDNWPVGCDSSITMTPGTDSTYDMTLQLGSSPAFSVFAKIVDTVEGNSGGDEGLIKSGVVLSNSGEVAVMHVPYLYTLEIDSENMNNTTERAKLSALCQY